MSKHRWSALVAIAALLAACGEALPHPGEALRGKVRSVIETRTVDLVMQRVTDGSGELGRFQSVDLVQLIPAELPFGNPPAHHIKTLIMRRFRILAVYVCNKLPQGPVIVGHLGEIVLQIIKTCNRNCFRHTDQN